MRIRGYEFVPLCVLPARNQSFRCRYSVSGRCPNRSILCCRCPQNAADNSRNSWFAASQTSRGTSLSMPLCSRIEERSSTALWLNNISREGNGSTLSLSQSPSFLCNKQAMCRNNSLRDPLHSPPACSPSPGR